MNNRRLAFFTTIAVIAAFVTVVYSSCKKEENTPAPDACATVTCQNEGICYKGMCTCPVGFDGATCENRWINRYAGTWDVVETVTGSSYAPNKGTTRSYVSQIKAKPGEPGAFLLDGIKGTTSYNGLVGDMGMNDKRQRAASGLFQLRTPQSFGQGINAVNFSDGGGTLNEGSNHIEGTYYTYYFNAADSTLITDTTSFVMDLQ